jgi:multiple sugar transport system substrate-binding protein
MRVRATAKWVRTRQSELIGRDVVALQSAKTTGNVKSIQVSGSRIPHVALSKFTVPQMNRRQILQAGAVTFGAVLSGCGGFRRSSAASAKGDLTFTTWGTESELAGFKKAIAAFESANPGTRVLLNPVPYQQMFQNIDAQLQSNTAPDVFRVDYRTFGTYAGRKQLLDLSPHIDASFREQFTDTMWRAVQQNDRPYGVPHHTDTSALLYNVAALKEAGIASVPTTVESAWTWEEFEQILLKLKTKSPAERYPLACNWQGQGVTRWLSWLFQADGRLLDDQLTSPAIDSSAGSEALDFTKSFFERKLVPENNSVKSATYASDLFFTETVAMTFGGAFLLPDAAKTAKFEWGVTFAPRNKRSGGDLGGNALVATAGTKNPEVAAKFLTFMTERKTMEEFCAGSSLLPTRKDLVASGLQFAVRPELSNLFLQQASTVRPTDAAQIASPSMAAINSVLSQELEQAFVGDQSTKDTLAKLSTGITKALSR